jgi:hypothetical protein
MITLREGTTFDAAAPGDVAWVTEKNKDENLEAREIYAQKPYHDIRARVETSLGSELFLLCLLFPNLCWHNRRSRRQHAALCTHYIDDLFSFTTCIITTEDMVKSLIHIICNSGHPIFRLGGTDWRQ